MASDGLGGPSEVPAHHLVDGTAQSITITDAAESAGRDEEGVDLCQFFLMGKCRFGQRCRLSHSDPSVDDSGAVSSDQDDTQHHEKTEKLKKEVNKAKQPKSQYEAKDVNKKPRMRTADDVISRILWDPSVDASEFTVGYVDRFLGVLERPFKDFKWDTNPCDCDYTTDLALPRHRIQYFIYRGHRLWDRHTRTDRVFGSTGQSLAPPFGGEDELKGLNAEEQEHQEDLKTTIEQPPAVCGQEVSEEETCTYLEDERPSEMNIHTLDSTQQAPKSRGNASQEEQESQGASRTEATTSPKVSMDQMSSAQKEGANVKEEADEVEWQESWEGNQDSLSYLGALNISQTCSPLQQREEKPGGGGPQKKRPTHFITFRANTRAILSGFQQLHEEIVSLLPSSAPHWQPSSSLHVTLCLLVLAGPAEVAAAVEILQRFARLDRNPRVSLTFPLRLKDFNGKVLFLSPQPQLHLQQLNSGLQEAYRKKGLLHKDSKNPRYHLTLAKVDREGDRIFEGVRDLKVGKGLNFGRLPINTLLLCAMGFPEGGDFYETVCTVTLH